MTDIESWRICDVRPMLSAIQNAILHCTTETMRNNSSSLRRALTILEVVTAVAGRDKGANLAELADGAETSKSTVLRLMAPLIEQRLVRQDADGTYRMGIGALGLAGACLADLDIRSAAQPTLREVADATGQPSHLLVYSERSSDLRRQGGRRIADPDGVAYRRYRHGLLDGIRQGDAGASRRRGVRARRRAWA